MKTMQRLVPGLLLALGLALGLTACGSGDDTDSGIASASGDATTSSTPSASAGNAQDQALKFAQCMRENGIAMEDPKDGKPAPLSQDAGTREEVAAATAKCKQYMPSGGDLPKDDPQALEQKRKLAQCMRENGVPKFSDPDEKGGIVLPEGVDPNSETFKAAQKKCEQFEAKKPEGAVGPGQQTGGKQQ